MKEKERKISLLFTVVRHTGLKNRKHQWKILLHICPFECTDNSISTETSRKFELLFTALRWIVEWRKRLIPLLAGS